MINIYRKAVYDSCKLAGIPVYDYWVTDGQFPYVIISEVNEDSTDMKLNTKRDYLFTVDVFEKSKGKTGIVNYTKTIKEALRAIDGVGVKISSRYFSDVEPMVIHGIITLEFTKYERMN